MPENINELYSRFDFIINGGAVKTLTDFLTAGNINAVIAEPGTPGFLNVIDAAGLVPQSLTIKDDVSKLFPHSVAKEAFELDYSEEAQAVRIRGSHWELYILLKSKPQNPHHVMGNLAENFGH